MRSRWVFVVVLLSLGGVLAEDCSPDDIFPCSHNIVGNLILMILYGLVLAAGAKIISDGSELLLRILDPGVIGGFVLPVLGAVPDAAIIILSCKGQKEISVGVGTLAGSTVMLLTLAWVGSMYAARCDLGEDGTAQDGVLTMKKSLSKTGVTVDKETARNSLLMLVTSASYLIVQGIAFVYVSKPDSHTAKTHERNFALATFIVSAALFVGYSVYQVVNTKVQEMAIARAKEEARREKIASQWNLTVNLALLQSRGTGLRFNSASGAGGGEAGEESPLLGSTNAPRKEVDVGRFARRWREKAQRSGEEEDVESEEEDDGLSKGQVATRSAILLVIGVVLVTVFSDPMVDVITRIGDETNIPPFYVSFVVTPGCSNASELISSLIFASRKTASNSTITFSQLLGAATMNNTLGLACLTALIYFKDFVWTFSAETLCILVTIWVVGLSALKSTYRFVYVIHIGAMYFVALGIVVFFENVVHWR